MEVAHEERRCREFLSEWFQGGGEGKSGVDFTFYLVALRMAGARTTIYSIARTMDMIPHRSDEPVEEDRL